MWGFLEHRLLHTYGKSLKRLAIMKWFENYCACNNLFYCDVKAKWKTKTWLEGYNSFVKEPKNLMFRALNTTLSPIHKMNIVWQINKSSGRNILSDVNFKDSSLRSISQRSIFENLPLWEKEKWEFCLFVHHRDSSGVSSGFGECIKFEYCILPIFGRNNFFTK